MQCVMQNADSEIYMVYARLIDFPAPELAGAAQDGSIGRRLARLHACAGAPAPPPMRTDSTAAILEQLYISTFDIGAPEPPAPLYETAYACPREGRLQVLEEIVRFYEFFDLKPAGRKEMPDHLTVELEFLGALAHMEWLAQQQGARTDAFRLAQHDFLERHLVPTLRSLRARPISEPFYRQLVEGLLMFAADRLEKTARQAADVPAEERRPTPVPGLGESEVGESA